MLFDRVSVGVASPRASNRPSQSDCNTVLSMLNTGNFHARELPQGNILKLTHEVRDRVSLRTGRLICHTVARDLAKEFSSWGWQQTSGYLCISSIDKDCLTQEQSKHNTTPDFIVESSSRQVITCLNHHSVLSDREGNYIECLPEGWYPIDKFVFIPHLSGQNGYSLHAM